MSHALKALEEIKDEVAQSPAAISAESLYGQLLVAFPLRPLETEEEFRLGRHIVSLLMKVLGEKDPEDEAAKADIQRYLKELAKIVETYEKSAFPEVGAGVSARDMLEFLMKSNGLSQDDLKKELGGQSVVSSILKGRRNLNLGQIKSLSIRFNVPPQVFINVEEDKKLRAQRDLAHTKNPLVKTHGEQIKAKA